MPLESVREYLEMCNTTRRSMSPSDLHTHDEWVTTFRRTLEETYHLDITDANIVAAVAAGVVEGLSAAIEDGTPATALMSLGWALYDLAEPHLAPAVSL